MRYYVLAILAASGAMIAGLMLATIPDAAPPPADAQLAGEEGKPMPVFQLPTFNGDTVSTADVAGTPLVIHSWAAWSPFCVKELQDLAAVQREFGERVSIVAINRAEARETAQGFTNE